MAIKLKCHTNWKKLIGVTTYFFLRRERHMSERNCLKASVSCFCDGTCHMNYKCAVLQANHQGERFEMRAQI